MTNEVLRKLMLAAAVEGLKIPPCPPGMYMPALKTWVEGGAVQRKWVDLQPPNPVTWE